MGSKNPGIITPRNCDASVRQAIQQLATKIVGLESQPTFSGLTLSDLTALRLLASNADKGLASVLDLTDWIAGTSNQVNVTDDDDGTLTLSTPQDIDENANPTFEGFTIEDASNLTVVFCDADEFYITQSTSEIAAGNPIGLLLALTYPGE